MSRLTLKDYVLIALPFIGAVVLVEAIVIGCGVLWSPLDPGLSFVIGAVLGCIGMIGSVQVWYARRF